MQSDRPLCVVFGGGGFLGTHLCLRLQAEGFAVRAFGRRGQVSYSPEIDFRLGEFSDTAAVMDALREATVVYHLIHSTVPLSADLDIIADLEGNVIPSVALLNRASGAGVKRIVFVSSGGTVYGRTARIPTEESDPTEPITAYGVSKLAIEKYLALYQLQFGLDYRILRVSNPFGPRQIPNKRQGLIAEVISRAMCGQPIEIWGDGTVVRDFVYVDDVVDALTICADDKGTQRLYNIGSGIGRSVRQVLSAVESTLGSPLNIIWRGPRVVDVPRSVLSIERARQDLGWSPSTPFEIGISRTIEWWKNASETRQSKITPPRNG